jgi:hypothetical protein
MFERGHVSKIYSNNPKIVHKVLKKDEELSLACVSCLCEAASCLCLLPLSLAFVRLRAKGGCEQREAASKGSKGRLRAQVEVLCASGLFLLPLGGCLACAGLC